MENKKAWYTSKIMWLSIVAVVAGAISQFMVTSTDIQYAGLLAVILGALNGYLRFNSTTTLE